MTSGRSNRIVIPILFIILIFLNSGCKNDEVIKSSAKTITDLKIDNLSGADFKFDATTSTYTVTVPRGTNLSTIPINFTIPQGASSVPEPGTIQDFAQPVSYTVTAEDGSKQVFKIIVQTAKSDEKTVSELIIEGIPSAIVTYNAPTLTFKITVPGKTDLKTLKPVFALSQGASSSPASGIIQDFSNPVIYTITAEDGSRQQYRFMVEKQAVSNEALITDFSFKNTRTHQLEINNELGYVSIMIFADTGVELTALEPQISLSEGASLAPGSENAHDFSPANIPFMMEVTAEDGVTKKQYDIYVTLHYETEYWSFEVDGVAQAGSRPGSSNYHRSLSGGSQSAFQTISIFHTKEGGLDWQLDLMVHGTSEEIPMAWGSTPTVPLQYVIAEKTTGISAHMNVFNGAGIGFYSNLYNKEDAGKITFTRVDKYFVEGTFEGFAKNNTGQTVKITNGKFRARRDAYTVRR